MVTATVALSALAPPPLLACVAAAQRGSVQVAGCTCAHIRSAACQLWHAMRPPACS